MHQQVSKEEAHLFEELNVIDVGIVNEESQELDPSASSHISSPGRLLNKSRRNSNSNIHGSIIMASPSIDSVNDHTFELDASDGDEISIATTVSSAMSSDSLHSNNDTSAANDNTILSQYPEIQFEMADQQSFLIEINDWFVMNDLNRLSSIRLVFQKTLDIEEFMTLTEDVQLEVITKLETQLEQAFKDGDLKGMLTLVVCFNYILMGCYDEITDEELQKINIFQNLEKLLTVNDGRVYETISRCLIFSMQNILEFNPINAKKANLVDLSSLSHYTMTILYFTLTFILDSDSHFYVSFKDTERLMKILDKISLMSQVLKCMDSWRWLSSNPESIQCKQKQIFKIRNLIILFSKLILFQFGGMERLKNTKRFLKERYKSDSSKLPDFKVSPLDYHYYKEDLKLRYPSLIPPSSSLSKEVEAHLEAMHEEGTMQLIGSKSVSESLMDEPFSQRRAAAISNGAQLPPPIHIATPAPSPTLAPINVESPSSSLYQERFNDYKDTKKIFQNTSSYPYLYPVDGDAPQSIKEASQIFFNSVKEDLNTKQFMNVYEDFIIQERGVVNTIDKSEDLSFTYDETDIDEFPDYSDEIKLLIRVESFYKDSLAYLNSLVKVMLQTIESSNSTREKQKLFSQPSDKDLTRDEISKISYETNSSQLPPFLKLKYEIARVKETTLKYSSQILFLFLKWFKLSHLLKFEFLSMIIFDNNYYQLTLDLIARNYEESLTHLNNLNDFMLENLNINDEDLMTHRFGSDELASLKYQYYSDANYSRFLKEEFDIPDYRFFDCCLKLSSNPSKIVDEESEKLSQKIRLFKAQELLKEEHEKKQQSLLVYYGINNPKIIIYNWKYCFIITNLLNVLYYTMNNKKTQRVNQLIEKKPTDLLRFCLRLHNKYFYRPILKIIKLIIPFNGRKWKSNNMDSISMVYLYYKVGLKDDWLTKNYNNPNLDIAEEFKRSYKQEYSLRSLIQYYNIKFYEKGMTDLGYEYFEMDYFNRELEILSRQYLSTKNGVESS